MASVECTDDVPIPNDIRPQIDEFLGSPKMSSLVDSPSTKSQLSVDIDTTDIYIALENIVPERSNIYEDPSSSSSFQGSELEPISQVPKLVASTVPKQSSARMVSPEEEMEITIGNSLNEYLCGNCSVNGFYRAISSSIPRLFYPRMVRLCYMIVLGKPQYSRLKTGVLFAKLMSQAIISVDDYCLGLEEIVSLGQYLVTDIPKIWDYVAEILVDSICDEALPLNRLTQSLNMLTAKDTSKILGSLFKLVVIKNSAVFLQSICKKSGIHMTDFIDSADIDKFTADYICTINKEMREEVKLKEVENSCRPIRYMKNKDAADYEKNTYLYRKVGALLNKLTPQNLLTVQSQIEALPIDTASRLQGVIDLVFEKAVDAPNVSFAYASICASLAMIQVPAQNSTPEKPEVVNFRKLLVNRCQVEFEKQSHADSDRKSKVKEINECSDQEKKKDLDFKLEEYDRILRMRSVGNIIFMGELFKQNMLTVYIMMRCLKNLLDNKDEESLECLCRLLTTIGKELEMKHVDLDQIFSVMKSLAEKRDGEVSSRIRFMLKDVIDLKNAKWIPRRQDHNPKTTDQIQKEADQEKLNIQIMHSASMPSRRYDRIGNIGGSQNTLVRKGGRGSRNNASDGWIAIDPRKRPNNVTVQSESRNNATDKKTEDLYRKVRGVLNMLSPQKFSTVLSQIKALQIDTASRLQGVIDIVFEKAVKDPKFSVAYASMCTELALMEVPVQNSTPEKTEFVNFRKLLINRCQVEFEKQSHDDSGRKSKVKEINECFDQEKKKDLEFELEEYDRRLRMRSVGNIIFIGELFKQNMLTVNIMMKCMKNLLDNKDEESLECLCKLLTTIGKELESKHVDLSQILSAMKSLAEKRDGKVSNRIHFMLKDVIDLKNSKWIPKSRWDDFVSNMGGSQNTLDRKEGRDNRNNASDSDGWIASNSRNRPSPFSVQSDKLKSKAPLIDEPLGNTQMFSLLRKGQVGSSVKSQPQIGLKTTNMYAAVENIEPERRNFGGFAIKQQTTFFTQSDELDWDCS